MAQDREQPYPCNLCPSRFGSRMELEEHQNSHTGMNPFECDVCYARFDRRSTLWNHKRIHSDAKPFVCSECQMTFKWKNSLKCHKEMHLRQNESPAHLEYDLRQLTYSTAAKRRLLESLEENCGAATSTYSSIHNQPLITTTTSKKKGKSNQGQNGLSAAHLNALAHQPLQASALIPPSDHPLELDTTSLDSLVNNDHRHSFLQMMYSDMYRHATSMLSGLDDNSLVNGQLIKDHQDKSESPLPFPMHMFNINSMQTQLVLDKEFSEMALESKISQVDRSLAENVLNLLNQHEYIKLLNVLELNHGHFHLYKILLYRVCSYPKTSASEEYRRIAPIREIFLIIYKNLKKQQSHYEKPVERYVRALHLFTARGALECANAEETREIRLKQSISLLRYIDILPPDRVFYEAGMACLEYDGSYRDFGFLLLKLYQDAVDAIVEVNTEKLDLSVFKGTDVPQRISLPGELWKTNSENEELDDWVVTEGEVGSPSSQLKTDQREIFEASLISRLGKVEHQCCITGYPIIGALSTVGVLYANTEDLHKFLNILRDNAPEELLYVRDFIGKWSYSIIFAEF